MLGLSLKASTCFNFFWASYFFRGDRPLKFSVFKAVLKLSKDDEGLPNAREALSLNPEPQIPDPKR